MQLSEVQFRFTVTLPNGMSRTTSLQSSLKTPNIQSNQFLLNTVYKKKDLLKKTLVLTARTYEPRK